jgi:outer membrane lipoprotein-sorting protein
MKQLLILLLILIQVSCYSQQKNPDELLNALKRKYKVIKDYTVDATVVVDVSFLNMPVKKAKIYYKYPDKVHVETKGFALLPKRTAGFDPGTFIGDKYTAVFIKTEKWGNSVIDVIKTIPNDVDNDVILSTFWIDEKQLLIRKMEINTKSGGTFHVDLDYNNLPFDLPQKLLVEFEVKDMNMPKSMTGEIPKKEKTKKGKDDKKGKVTITYSNYLVNKGLSDKLFEDKRQK